MNLFDMFHESPERSTSRMDGVIVGVVTNNEDPDKLSRVKIKYPLLDDQHETDWVRIATFMAGKEMGSLFIPEVGDEVLVAFHMGDIREPFVIGMLWNQDQPSPPMSENNDLRKIVSRAGHEVTFGDQSDDGKITIKTKKGQIIELGDKADTIKIGEQGDKNSIAISGAADGKVVIKSDSSLITLNIKGDISIESNKAVTIKSTQISIEATGKLELKGAMIDINASGIANLKGSMVKIN
ncbi:phage baseplate assembly protein V [Paenibacillus allorhizosphaerae]|uniref:Actin cross-linking toxin VgrG1 n=1 Tax=Paenibacillus allorhizosphaerae TaxID=2849866 RepID=A0ABN7TNS8_9BACL|nr:phage baseplate assembly protein V [Paenibacillus allorhizosphaerae]CAG7640757.1 Actin cross-linking toxin VgrG1 [Paenibacillus allorhizosphaerae]